MAVTQVFFIITAIVCYGMYKIISWHWQRRRLYELASKFGGPPALPFIGNALECLGDGEYLIRRLDELTRVHSWPLRLWIGPNLWIFINDPEHVKTVLVSPKTLDKGEIMVDYCRPVLNEGLLTAPGPKWKLHRKLINPTFNPIILDSFVEVFAAQSKIFTAQMERNLDGPEFEIFHLVSSCTLDMICETAMGVTVKAQTDKNCYYVEALQEIAAGVCDRIFSIWLHPDFIFNLSRIGREQRKYLKYLNNFTDNVIQMKQKKLLERDIQSAKTVNPDDSGESIPEKLAFLDHLMALPDRSSILSDEALREEIDTMVVAGNDTTAITNSFLLLMLATYPDVQEKVYQELYEIYGDADIDEHPITPQDLPRMKYLERVIRETMRLFPAGPFMMRAVRDDLDIGDYTLPKGSTVVVSILPLQRSEKYWPNPLEFDPDRFLPEELAKRHPYAFMAFGGGPRNCIGPKYAMRSMKTLMTTVLRKYILKKDKIIPVKDIRLQLELMLKTVEPIKLRIERRTRVMSRQHTGENSTAKSK